MDTIRVRSDKIRPNDSYTANNVWQTIQYPVTEELIKGKKLFSKELLPKQSIKEYSYYVGDDTGSDKPLRNFIIILKINLNQKCYNFR